MVGLAGCGAGYWGAGADVYWRKYPLHNNVLVHNEVDGNSCMNILMKRKVVMCGWAVIRAVVGVIVGAVLALYYISNFMLRNKTVEAENTLISTKNDLVAENGLPWVVITTPDDMQPAASHEVFYVTNDSQPTDVNHDLQDGDDPFEIRGGQL